MAEIGSFLKQKLPPRRYSGPDDQRPGSWWKWYRHYLESDAWLRRRELVLARDNYQCRRCQGEAECVHHVTYARVGYEALRDLVALCNRCHAAVHNMKKPNRWRH